MGVYIKPCRGCPLQGGCELKETFRKRAMGIGARTVAFNCPRLAKEVRVGRRIRIIQPVATENPLDDRETVIWRVKVKATIASVRPDYSFSSVIDVDEMERITSSGEVVKGEWTPEVIEQRRFRKMQKHSRIMEFLDEQDARTCGKGELVGPDGYCLIRGEARADRFCICDGM